MTLPPLNRSIRTPHHTHTRTIARYYAAMLPPPTARPIRLGRLAPLLGVAYTRESGVTLLHMSAPTEPLDPDQLDPDPLEQNPAASEQAAPEQAAREPNRAFGYDLRGEVIETEAELIRTVARRIAYEGSNFSAEARWLQAQGAWTPAAQWFPARVSRILLSPRVVGDRPALRGRTPHAILDRDPYEPLCAAADTRHRAKAGRPEFKASSLLGGIVHCARCGAPMKLTGAAGKRSYRCPANRRLRPGPDGEGGSISCGRAQIVEAGLDSFVAEAALAWWAHDSAPARANGVPELRAIVDELTIATEALTSLKQQYAISLIDAETFKTQKRKLENRISVLEPWLERLAETGLPDVEGEAIYGWWESAGLEARHALVGAVFPRLFVGPSSKPGPGRGSDQIDTSRVLVADASGAPGELLRFPPGHDEDD